MAQHTDEGGIRRYAAARTFAFDTVPQLRTACYMIAPLIDLRFAA